MARSCFVGCLLLVILSFAAPARGEPQFVPADPPWALVQADPGRTTFSLTTDGRAWTAEISRSVTPACDIAVVVGSRQSPAVRARLLAARSLFPLETSLEIGTDQVAVLGALCLGPVRLVGDRAWGQEPLTRIAVHAADTCFLVATGLEWRSEGRPFVSATWLPPGRRLVSLTLLVFPNGCRATLGATW